MRSFSCVFLCAIFFNLNKSTRRSLSLLPLSTFRSMHPFKQLPYSSNLHSFVRSINENAVQKSTLASPNTSSVSIGRVCSSTRFAKRNAPLPSTIRFSWANPFYYHSTQLLALHPLTPFIWSSSLP